MKGRYSEFPKQYSVVASLGSHWLISLNVSVRYDSNTPFPLSVAFIITDTVLLVTQASVKIKPTKSTIHKIWYLYCKFLSPYSKHYTHVHATPHPVASQNYQLGAKVAREGNKSGKRKQ